MSVGILLVVHGPAEARLAGELGARRDVVVSRRCADLTEALAAAMAGVGRVIVVSDLVAGPDTELVAAARDAGVGLVVLLEPGDDLPGSRSRWVQVGVRHLGRVDETGEEIAQRVLAADLGPDAPILTPVTESLSRPTEPVTAGIGRVVAVWGPHGSTGRSTVAVNTAAELALRGGRTLLLDADTRGASLAQLFGVLDEAPTLLAAVRACAEGRLGAGELVSMAPEVSDGLALLSHSPDPTRWREVRPSALGPLLALAGSVFDWVVVDLPGGGADDGPHGRDAVLDVVLDLADVALLVGSADPVGLQRWVRAWLDHRDRSDVPPGVPVLNRVGPGGRRREVRTVLRRLAQLDDPVLLPLDEACASAVDTGRTLAETAPRSPLRVACAQLADQLDAGLLDRWNPGFDPAAARS